MDEEDEANVPKMAAAVSKDNEEQGYRQDIVKAEPSSALANGLENGHDHGKGCPEEETSSSTSSDDDEDRGQKGSEVLAALLTASDRQIEIAEHDMDVARSCLGNPVLQPKDPLPGTSSSSSSSASATEQQQQPLLDRLLRLHLSEGQRKVEWSSHLNPCSNLLTALCERENPNRLVLTLWPGNEGYTLHLATKDGQEIELLRLPYEEDHLLRCVDNQELPSTLLDLFDSLTVDLYDSGCIICEVRDVRRRQLQLQQLLQQQQQQAAVAASMSSLSPSVIAPVAEVSHVLLRPTTQSIVCDSNLIVAANLPPSSSLQQHKSSKLSAASGRGVGDVASQWSAEERAQLEGQLAMRTLEPLCLDPSPVVSLVARKMEVARQKYNTVPLSRAVRKYSQAGINRKRKLDAVPASSSAGAAGAAVRLHDFFTHLNKRKKVSPQDTLARHQQMVRTAARKQQLATPGASLSPPQTNGVPASTDVSKLARAIHRRQEVNDMTPHTVEEYILETAERGSNRVYHTKLTIFQRVSNEEYMGELYVERDFKENDNKGSTCRFTLGTRPHALRYINQFTEIFTEEGRKSVKITHKVPGQQPRVTYTPGMRERMNAAAAAAAAAAVVAGQQRVVTSTAQAGGSGRSNQPPVVAAALAAANAAITGPMPQKTILQKTLTGASPAAAAPSTAPILQQQLSAPLNGPVAASPAATIAAAAHLPQHPIPISRAASLPQVAPQQQPQPQQTPPPSIIQNQLTIQPGAANPLLPLTPLAPNVVAGVAASPSPALTSPAASSTSVNASPLKNPPTPQQQPQQAAGDGDQQEKAISAIMQSLMQESAKFDPEAKSTQSQQPQQQQQLPSPLGVQHSQLLTPAQLPTRPVPQASLGNAIKVQQQQPQVSNSSGQPVNTKLIANRVSLQNLLTAQVSGQPQQQQQQQQPTVVVASTAAIVSTAASVTAMPQLAAQLSRPVALPPSYSQAVAQAQIQAQAKQVTAGQPRSRIILAQQQQQLRRPPSSDGAKSQDSPALHSLLSNTPSADNIVDDNSNSNSNITQQSILERLVAGQPPQQPQQGASAGRRRSSDKGSLSQDAPGLQALLANAPSADTPAVDGVASFDGVGAGGSAGGGNSLILERLMSGGSTSNGLSSPQGSSGSQGMKTNAQQQASGANGAASVGTPDSSTQEITLATILAKPPMGSSAPSTPTTPTMQQQHPGSSPKASPLMHQLQQQPNAAGGANRQLLHPVQSSPMRQQQQQQQLTSPTRQQQPSPARTPQPTIPASSPGRPFSLPQSPSGRPSGQLVQAPTSRNQQQLLQQQQQPIVTVASVVQNSAMLAVPVQQQQQQSQQHNDALTNGMANNGQQQQPQQQQNVVSLQNLLQQHGVVQVSASAVSAPVASTATVQSTGNMVQLHVPGLATPVTLNLGNLQPQVATSDPNQGQQQQQGVILATAPTQASSQPKQQQQQQPQQQQVVFQQNNFIQLPQQPAAGLKAQQIKGAAQLVQVRPGNQQQQQQQPQSQQSQQQQPVFLQMVGQQGVLQTAAGQPQQIQIVRTVPQGAMVVGGQQQQQQQQQLRNLPQQPSPQHLVQIGNSLKSPGQQMPPPAPSPVLQHQSSLGVPPSPSSSSSSMTSPQTAAPPDSPRLLSQLSGGGDPPTSGSGPAAKQKMTHRTQRKQSLK